MSEPRFTSVFRFADLDDLRAVEASDLRRRYLDEVVDLVEADPIWSKVPDGPDLTATRVQCANRPLVAAAPAPWPVTVAAPECADM